MGASLFPPLPPDALVFVPGPPEFADLVRQELGDHDDDGEFIDTNLGNAFFALPGSQQRRQQLQECLERVKADSQSFAAGPDLDFTSLPVGDDEFLNEGGPAGEVDNFIDMAAELGASDADVDELVAVAGLIPDEGTGPPPDPPTAPPGDSPPPPVPPPPPEGAPTCVTFEITNCLAGGCGTFCACATDAGTIIIPIGEGGECG